MPDLPKKICCIGAGYVGGPTMAMIALKCPMIEVLHPRHPTHRHTRSFLAVHHGRAERHYDARIPQSIALPHLHLMGVCEWPGGSCMRV